MAASFWQPLLTRQAGSGVHRLDLTVEKTTALLLLLVPLGFEVLHEVFSGGRVGVCQGLVCGILDAQRVTLEWTLVFLLELVTTSRVSEGRVTIDVLVALVLSDWLLVVE